MTFQPVPGRYDGPRLEQEMLRFWREQEVFPKTLERSQGRPRFTFYEGPPTANGRPGIHHVLARSFKDIFLRYKTMRGFHVPRRAGWDTHGLPVEHEVEKELGIFDKSRIEAEVGIVEFTRRCRESVMRYVGDWEKMTERMGFWVDMRHAYFTLDNKYIESVWWLLKRIWDQGLMYQDYKVVPYDPRIGTTLSSHEVALGYKEVEDPSVYVRFPLEGEPGTSFLVWTTTPWTLPANLAVAVGADIDYVYAALDGDRPETLILAEARLAEALGDKPHRVLRKRKGRELVGRRYRRPFDYLSAEGDCWRVLAADFVSTEDGTGIVHIAPAYGADDLALAKQHGIPVVHGVGLDGHFLPAVKPVAGKFFKEADPVLTRELKDKGLLFRAGKILHNYPFGWRTGDPLIYYAKNAWYIRTGRIKERMVELNRTINWVPETIREGRFGNWLDHNVDWALSRERFWGTPLPLWTDGDGGFLMAGSVEQLEALTGRKLDQLDLHRPAVDEITFQHPATGRTMRRVPEVIDCWFDSGAMPFAQLHYPFENRDEFDASFPADYIVEAIDQTRGWFYTLHAEAALVTDSVSYKNVICLSHIVDKDGRKMSKSQGNIINPYEVFDSVGADPLRWYFLARVAPDQQKRISLDIVGDVAGTFVNTLWNAYAFFVLYANLDGVDLSRAVPPRQRQEIDRWVLALLQRTMDEATRAMDAYDTKTAGEAIESFVDQLSNWYIRRNRRRFWKSEAGADKQAAYLTLYECLMAVTRLIAPFMPFLAEALHQNLARSASRGANLSVHMESWPETDAALWDRKLLEDVTVVQRVVSLGRAARASAAVRTRQPLPAALVRVPDKAAEAALRAHEEQVLDELNVKSLQFIARDDELVSYKLKPNLPRLGKRHGKLIPAIREALAAADATAIAAAAARQEGFTLVAGGETLHLEPDDVLIETSSAEGYVSAREEGYLVALDTRITEDLRREGLVREIVRTIQEARKQAGLEVSDRIRLRLSGSPQVQAVLADPKFRDYIGEETLTAEWAGDSLVPRHRAEESFDQETWKIELDVAT